MEILTIYVLPGCSKCAALEASLQSKGIAYATKSLLDDRSVAEEVLQGIGALTAPVMKSADCWYSGADIWTHLALKTRDAVPTRGSKLSADSSAEDR